MSCIIEKVKEKIKEQNFQQKFKIISGSFGEIITVTICNYLTNVLEFPQNIKSQIVFIINLTTCFYFFVLYIFEVFREFWLVNHFDYSKRYDSLHLRTYRLTYPDIFSKLEIINKNYLLIYQISRVLFLINYVVSSIILDFSDYKAITAFFTNGWVVWGKINKGLEIGRESLSHQIGYSYYNSQNLSFNRIDVHIKKHVSISRISSPPISFNASLNASLNETNANIFFEQEKDIINETHIE